MNKQSLVTLMTDMAINPKKATNFALEKGVADVDQHLRETLFAGVDFTSNPKKIANDVEKAIRRDEALYFEIIEEVITNTIMRGVDENEFFRRFAETRNMLLGDTPEFVMLDDGIVTVSEVSRGNWDIHRQKIEGGKSFTVQTKTYGVAVYQDWIAFALGRITIAEMVGKAAQGMLHHLNQLVAGAFGNASAALPPQLRENGAFDLQKLTTLYDRVAALTGSAIVVGTKTAFAGIIAGADASLLTPEQIEDQQKNGVVRYYQGMTFVQLPQVIKAGTWDFAYDDKKLLILSGSEETKPVKIVQEGTGHVRDKYSQVDNMDQTLEHTYVTSVGVNVVLGTVFADYTLL